MDFKGEAVSTYFSYGGTTETDLTSAAYTLALYRKIEWGKFWRVHTTLRERGADCLPGSPFRGS